MSIFYTLDELEGPLAAARKPQLQAPAAPQPNPGNFRDVHVYDGKIPASSNPALVSIPAEEKSKLFSKLKTLLIHPLAKVMVDRIQAEDSGIDPANNVRPSDILSSILTRRMSVDIFLLLEEQLADNFLLGQCMQGRTTRLIQILDLTIS